MDMKLIMAIITIITGACFLYHRCFLREKGAYPEKAACFHFLAWPCFWHHRYYDHELYHKRSGGAQNGMGLHGITGALAIVLMLFHALWATLVLVKKDKKKQESFHKFSIFVWLVWLVPYILGMVIGMSHWRNSSACLNCYPLTVKTKFPALQKQEMC